MPLPLSLLAVSFACGIGLGELLGVTLAWAGVAAVVAGVVAWVARRRKTVEGMSLLALACAAGIVGAAASRVTDRAAVLDDQPWTFRGEVIALPERAFHRTRLTLRLREIWRRGETRSVDARIWLGLPGDPLEPLLPGDQVVARARLRAPRGFLDPGAVDGVRTAAEAGVVAVASVHDPAALARLDEPSAAGILRMAGRVRARLRAAIGSRLDGEPRALVAALVVGDRGEIAAPLDQAFRAAGVSHVLSVSGLHLAIAALLFYGGLTRALLRVPRLAEARVVRRWAAVASLPAVVSYTLVTGAEVATVRACVVALVFLVGAALGRRTRPEHALALAALALLSVTPLALFSVSFQLSFAASLGTAVFLGRFPIRWGRAGWVAWLARWAVQLLLSSTGAFFATAPLAAWHFAELSVGGLLANLVVVPLAELGVVPFGLFGAIMSEAPWPAARGGALLLAIAGWLAARMADCVRIVAALVPSFFVAAPTLLELALGYAALTAFAVPGRRALRMALLCITLATASSAIRACGRRLSRTLVATFLDVGQGDACVIELGLGRVLVVDGGGSFDPTFDPGEQVVAPFLRRRGISRIDVLVLSHPHPDHANGLPFLADHFDVGEIWTNGQATAQVGALRLLEVARRRAIPVRAPRAVALGASEVSPLGTGEPDPTLSENDNSLVLRVVHQGRSLLFPGDVEREGEARLLGRLGSLRAEVLKVPHHGSRTSSTAALLAAVRPRIAVFSVGAHNRWAFPHGDVLARYGALGVRMFRTDLDGATTVRVDGGGNIAVERYRDGTAGR